jgi:beta-glucosidase
MRRPMLTLSRRRLLAASLGSLALRQASQPDPASAEELTFSHDFMWGASTSSYQIEGAADADGRGKSIWDIFSHTPGRVEGDDTGDVACDHYHRWREDIELVARANFSAYRFSTSWPRIMPAGAGTIEPRGLDFYDRLVDGLLARGITPFLCLYHWDLPQALQDTGGWLNRDIAHKFADYAAVVARRLGTRVKLWATFNEPNIHALFGHGVGSHAPGLKGLPNMLAAMHHQNLAHGRAVQALRAESGDLQIGTIVSLQPARPSSASDLDRNATMRFDAMWNGACLDPLLQGAYPAPVAADFAPLIADGDLAAIHRPLDFLGVNYYAPMYVADAPGSLFGAWFGAVPPGTPFTAMGWPVDAAGLAEELISLSQRYGRPEIYVTENGACYDDTVAADGVVHDGERLAFIRDHLAAAGRAVAAGVKLRGYFVWSLLDNFEWASGYSRRFGIIRVDFADQRRTPKASYQWLAEFIKGQSRR